MPAAPLPGGPVATDITAFVATSAAAPFAEGSPEWTGALQLVDLIKRTVAPNTWDWVGGSGVIRLAQVHFGQAGFRIFIVVLQTDPNNALITNLLAQLQP